MSKIGHKRRESSQPNSEFGVFQHNFQEGLEGCLSSVREDCERGLDLSIRPDMENSDNSLIGFSGRCSDIGGRTQANSKHGHNVPRRGSNEEGPLVDRMEFEGGGGVGASF